MGGLAEHVAPSGRDVDDPCHGQEKTEYSRQRHQAESPLGTPRRVQETDRQCRPERTEMATDVVGATVQLAGDDEHQVPDQQRQTDGDDGRAKPRGLPGVGNRDPAEDIVGRPLTLRPESGETPHPVGSVGEGRAAWAGFEVGLDDDFHLGGELVVDSSRDQIGHHGAVGGLHVCMVVSAWAPVPGLVQGWRTVIDRWTELALAAQDGNAHALDQFVRESFPTVQRLCRHLGDPDTADDLVQDTYGRALRSLPRFRRDGSARSWLLAIARHACADASRARIRARERTIPWADRMTETATIDRGWAEVDDLLRSLDRPRREAFVLTQILRLPYAEAARVADCPVGTIRSRVSRARADLVAALDDPDHRGIPAVG